MKDKEQEANYFALCLLMPEEFIAEYLSQHHVDMADDKAVTQMARAFQVPASVMALRLGTRSGKI